MLLGGAKLQGPELVQETFRLTNPPGDFQQCGRAFCTTVLLRMFKALISKPHSTPAQPQLCPAIPRRFGSSDTRIAGDCLDRQLRHGRRPLRKQRLAPGTT